MNHIYVISTFLFWDYFRLIHLNIRKKWLYQGCIFLRWNQTRNHETLYTIRAIINNCNWWSHLCPWPYIKHGLENHSLTSWHEPTQTQTLKTISRVIINDYISFYNIVLLNCVRQKKTVMLHLFTKYKLLIFCHCLFMEMYAIFQKSIYRTIFFMFHL